MFRKADLGYLYLGGNKTENPQVKTKPGLGIHFLLLYCGVFLPLAAAGYESATHTCAHIFFDPLPGTLHSLLFALIPLSNFLVWMSLRWDMTQHYGFMFFINGMAVGVGLLYSLMFLPIMPISCLAVIVGIGLFGLAPLISLICLWRGGAHLNKLVGGIPTYFHPPQVKHLGHLVVLAVVVAIELPSTLTRVAIDMACQGKQQGLDILRTVGNQEVMLRACYERSGRATDILGSLYEVSHHNDVDKVRQIFYHTTGRAFNSLPIPMSARATIRNAGWMDESDDGGLGPAAEDEFDADPDVAGEMVSGVSRGLGVSGSKLSAHIDADAAIAQCDWRLSLNNKSNYDREVRAKIKLPAGAVVNGASLIVNGKEYESDILVRDQARAVYKQAVSQKRNPLLVSTCGPDTVLVQCYPVPPRRDISLRLQVIAPLTLDSKKQGILTLPQFEERNFQVNVPHKIAIDSSGDITFASALGFSKKQIGSNCEATGDIEGGALASGQGVIHVARHEEITKILASDAFVKDGCIKESFEAKSVQAPSKLRVIVDGSIWMAPYIKEIVEALQALPPDMKVQLFVVTDQGGDRLSKYIAVSSPEFKQALNQLASRPYVGGQYDADTLWDAVRAAHKHANTAALWIHGPQPYASYTEGKVSHYFSAQSMDWMLSAHPDRIMLYDMQVASGPNDILAQIKDRESICKIARAGSVNEDLKRLFDSWSGRAATYAINYQFEPDTTFKKEFTDNKLPLSQLWAAKVITKDVLAGSANIENDLKLAHDYHIVTPLSSAVLITPVPLSPMPNTGLHRVRGNRTDLLSSVLGDLDGVAQQLRTLNFESSKDDKYFASPGVDGTLSRGSFGSARDGVGAGSGTGSGLVTLGANSHTDGPSAKPGAAGEAKKAFGNNGPTAPNANNFDAVNKVVAGHNPLVPESDSWLLLAVTGLILGGFLFNNRKRVRRA